MMSLGSNGWLWLGSTSAKIKDQPSANQQPNEYEYEYDIYSLYKHMADINGPEKHYTG